ncbi:unnamed protein product [Paramecium primaurelia]|uniref:Dynein light chain n=1 Tax=Paramecium primaurelia TaxID=5886 RepID=A0A8S1PBC6_PARPR|nr:unnamed protein product [Paramecium primaurelia]
MNKQTKLIQIKKSLVKYENPIEVSNLNDAKGLQGKKKAQLFPQNQNQIQYVSHVAATREDVGNLQKLLDGRLLARQAKEISICPIREELLSQCFDEIIRQVIIDCPERGLLLMRVRDELKITIAAYQTLYTK